MKRGSLLIVAIVFALSACKKDAAINAKKGNGSLDYNDSYSAWTNYKNKVHNNYTYTVTTASFTGAASETILVINNGMVISRDYFAYAGGANSTNRTIVKQWQESGNNLNTHSNEGASAVTIDEVYNMAATVWLKADPKTNDIYFETKNNGLISTCGYYPLGCQDDCFNGINISSITSP